MILWKDGGDGGPGTGNKFNVTGLYRKQGKGRFSLLFPIAMILSTVVLLLSPLAQPVCRVMSSLLWRGNGSR